MTVVRPARPPPTTTTRLTLPESVTMLLCFAMKRSRRQGQRSGREGRRSGKGRETRAVAGARRAGVRVRRSGGRHPSVPHAAADDFGGSAGKKREPGRELDDHERPRSRRSKLPAMRKSTRARRSRFRRLREAPRRAEARHAVDEMEDSSPRGRRGSRARSTERRTASTRDVRRASWSTRRPASPLRPRLAAELPGVERDEHEDDDAGRRAGASASWSMS